MDQVINVRQHLNSHGEPKVARRMSTLWPGLIVAFLVLVLSAGTQAQETQFSDLTATATVDMTGIENSNTAIVTAVFTNTGPDDSALAVFRLDRYFTTSPGMDPIVSVSFVTGESELSVETTDFYYEASAPLAVGETTTMTVLIKPVTYGPQPLTFRAGALDNEEVFEPDNYAHIDFTWPRPADKAYLQISGAFYNEHLTEMPDGFYIDHPYIFETIVTNAGGTAAEAVLIENELPDTFVIESVTTEVLSGSVLDVAQNGTTFSIGIMNSGSALKIYIRGHSTTNDKLTHTATVASPTPDDNLADNIFQNSIENLPSTDLVATITTDRTEMMTGETLTVNISYTNDGPNTITSAELGLDMSHDIIWVPQDKWEIVSKEFSKGVYQPAENNVVVPLESGETVTARFVLRPVLATALTLRATASGNIADHNPNNNVDDVEIMVSWSDRSVLQATLDASPEKVQAGGLVVQTMVVTNHGPDDATSISVENRYGEGDYKLDLLSIEDAGKWTIENGSPGYMFTASLPALAADESATITAIFKAVVNPLWPTLIKHSTVTKMPYAPSIRNQFETQITTDADPGADLLITAATPAPGVLNQNLTYNVRALNLGPDPTSSAYIGNILPEGVSLSSATSDKGTVQVNGKYINVSGVPLDVGEAATLTLNVVPTQTGVITNQSGLSSPNFDPDLANNVSVLDTLVTETAPGNENPDTENPVCSEAVDLSAGIDKLKLKGKYKKKTAEWQFKVNARVVVGNNGVECSPPTNIFLYLSDDPVLDASDALLATKTVKKVCPGKKPKKAKFKLKLDEAQNPYGRYLIAVADGDNIVVECNEANNAATGF